MGGGFLTFLAVGCPICNKLVVCVNMEGTSIEVVVDRGGRREASEFLKILIALKGISGALAYFEPVQH